MLQTSVASTAPFSQHSGHGNTLLGALPEEERALHCGFHQLSGTWATVAGSTVIHRVP